MLFSQEILTDGTVNNKMHSSTRGMINYARISIHGSMSNQGSVEDSSSPVSGTIEPSVCHCKNYAVDYIEKSSRDTLSSML